MIRPIVRMGNPILRAHSAVVKTEEIKTDQFASLIKDLKDSMIHYGGIGIAAPQIGLSKQVCIIELDSMNRYGELIEIPFTVFVNPVIEYLSGEVKGYWEGCLSVPGLRGYVERPQHIKVTYLNEKAEKVVREFKGFGATVVQHELDHLFGTLYIDRVEDPKLISFQEEYEQFIQNPSDS